MTLPRPSARPRCWTLLLVSLLVGAGCGDSLTPEELALPPPDSAAVGSKEPDPRHSSLDVDRSEGLIADGKDSVEVKVTLRNRANETLSGVAVQLSLGPPRESYPVGDRSSFSAVTDEAGRIHGTLASTVAERFPLTLRMTVEGRSVAFASTFVVEFVPGPAVALRLVNPVGTQTAGVPFTQVYVRAVDAQGNDTVTAQEVSLSLGSAPAGATLGGRIQATPGPVGLGPHIVEAAFPEAFLTVAGEGYTLRASAAGLQGVESEPFAVVAAGPAKYVLLDEPTDVVVGAPLPTLRVAHQDAYGNLVTRWTSWVSVRLLLQSVEAPLFGPRYVDSVEGIAEFAGLYTDQPAEGYRLEVGGSFGEAVLSRPFNVLPVDAAGTLQGAAAGPALPALEAPTHEVAQAARSSLPN